MLKNHRPVYVFLSLCLICLLVVGTHFYPDKENNITYTLKEHHGGLAVFSSEGNIIESIIATNISSLPDGDRKKLKNGITVSSEEELMSLIEDFLG